jgi:chromosome segregation ATPase
MESGAKSQEATSEANKMDVDKVIQWLVAQEGSIEALIDQLDEVQVEFNAQFDEFKASHDGTLDRLTDQVAERLDAIDPGLRAAIDERLHEERQRIEARRGKIRDEYLPQRQAAAQELLDRGQAELGELRALNPQLDAREEELKQEKAGLEAKLADLNEEIRQQSRGLGVALHFVAITKADRERHRILGRLEGVNSSLYKVRKQWKQERTQIEERQQEYQNKWQLESIAVARLQSELDLLDDRSRREDLALRRAIRNVLDALKEPSASSDPQLGTGLQEMIDLNIQTDAYHDGLASVGGFIGLLRGINNGLEAIRQSIAGLRDEQAMHSAYLQPLNFSLPSDVQRFHSQWPALAQQFADEKAFGASPMEFSASVEPILEGPLSQSNVEDMFNSLSAMIKEATARW